jgi:hypothetical protein
VLWDLLMGDCVAQLCISARKECGPVGCSRIELLCMHLFRLLADCQAASWQANVCYLLAGKLLFAICTCTFCWVTLTKYVCVWHVTCQGWIMSAAWPVGRLSQPE